jgi:hypothetical protein
MGMKELGLALVCAACAGVGVGCGGGSNPNNGCTTAAGTNKKQYVTNTLTLPKSNMDYPYDPNGSGTKRNQLGNLVNGLSSMLDPQAAASGALMSGSLILLLETKSSDATFTTDSCAGATISVGNSVMNPDYTGAGKFTVMMSGGTFLGPVAAGAFSSVPKAAMATMPVMLTIPLPLVPGAMPLPLVTTGAELNFTAAGGKVMGGVINGVIKKTDVDTKIIPAVAGLLNAQIAKDPMSSTSKTLLGLFDDGGVADPACSATMTCKNLDGSCAKKGDGIISDCELSTNGIIMQFLRADVAMFDAAGNYHPDPNNAHKDALTVGLGFTAVGATF